VPRFVPDEIRLPDGRGTISLAGGVFEWWTCRYSVYLNVMSRFPLALLTSRDFYAMLPVPNVSDAADPRDTYANMSSPPLWRGLARELVDRFIASTDAGMLTPDLARPTGAAFPRDTLSRCCSTWTARRCRARGSCRRSTRPPARGR
jgi:hypothetical protein